MFASYWFTCLCVDIEHVLNKLFLFYSLILILINLLKHFCNFYGITTLHRLHKFSFLKISFVILVKKLESFSYCFLYIEFIAIVKDHLKLIEIDFPRFINIDLREQIFKLLISVLTIV